MTETNLRPSRSSLTSYLHKSARSVHNSRKNSYTFVWGVNCVKFNMHNISNMSIALIGQTMPTCMHNMPMFMHNMPMFTHNMPMFMHNMPMFMHNMPIFMHNMPMFMHNMPVFMHTCHLVSTVYHHASSQSPLTQGEAWYILFAQVQNIPSF